MNRIRRALVATAFVASTLAYAPATSAYTANFTFGAACTVTGANSTGYTKHSETRTSDSDCSLMGAALSGYTSCLDGMYLGYNTGCAVIDTGGAGGYVERNLQGTYNNSWHRACVTSSCSTAKKSISF